MACVATFRWQQSRIDRRESETLERSRPSLAREQLPMKLQASEQSEPPSLLDRLKACRYFAYLKDPDDRPLLQHVLKSSELDENLKLSLRATADRALAIYDGEDDSYPVSGLLSTFGKGRFIGLVRSN